MLTEDEIKPGEKYTIELLCSHVYVYPEVICFESPTGYCMFLHKEDLECVKHAEAKPKYDPCRRFKKGDKVRVIEWNGRDIARVGMEGRVVGDERNSKVELAIDGWTKDVFYPACHLELVTPVEETEPYSIIVQPEGYHCVRIMKGTKIHSSIPFDEEECVCRTLEEAKAAAEEERDRLNAEHRKEQK